MTVPETEWISVAPGVLELPTTKFRIAYEAGSLVPFRVAWDVKAIPQSAHMHLADARAVAERHMAELIVMGFEP